MHILHNNALGIASTGLMGEFCCWMDEYVPLLYTCIATAFDQSLALFCSYRLTNPNTLRRDPKGEADL